MPSPSASFTLSSVTDSTSTAFVLTTEVACTDWVLLASLVWWTVTVATFGSDDPAGGL